MSGLFWAFLAGFVSFLAPCVLPLVPGYLSAVSAVDVGRLGERGTARRVVVASLPFVAGFSTVFVALGASFHVGAWRPRPFLERVLRLECDRVEEILLGFWGACERTEHEGEVPRPPKGTVQLGMPYADHQRVVVVSDEQVAAERSSRGRAVGLDDGDT